jgi:hypothetical protein
VCNDDAATCAEPDPPPPDDRPPVPDLPPISPPVGTTWYKPVDPLPNPNTVLTTPYDCSGWIGFRTFLQAETWFTRPGLDPNFGSTQLQVGACMPHKQRVAGTIPLDIVVGKFNFPE